MSRRASLFAKQNPEKAGPKVRFPDELVFLDNIKENDIPALSGMLRRASLQVDISGINDAGNPPLYFRFLDKYRNPCTENPLKKLTTRIKQDVDL